MWTNLSFDFKLHLLWLLLIISSCITQKSCGMTLVCSTHYAHVYRIILTAVINLKSDFLHSSYLPPPAEYLGWCRGFSHICCLLQAKPVNHLDVKLSMIEGMIDRRGSGEKSREAIEVKDWECSLECVREKAEEHQKSLLVIYSHLHSKYLPLSLLSHFRLLW